MGNANPVHAVKCSVNDIPKNRRLYESLPVETLTTVVLDGLGEVEEALRVYHRVLDNCDPVKAKAKIIVCIHNYFNNLPVVEGVLASAAVVLGIGEVEDTLPDDR